MSKGMILSFKTSLDERDDINNVPPLHSRGSGTDMLSCASWGAADPNQPASLSFDANDWSITSSNR